MIQRVTIKNFKSFREADLPLAPLTVLIGANASGKSNFVEAFKLLSWLASGRRLGDLPSTLRDQDIEIRGTFRTLAYQGSEISLGCDVSNDSAEPAGFSFEITLKVTRQGLRVAQEQLDDSLARHSFPLYKVAEFDPSHEFLEVAYNNFEKGKKPRITCTNQQAVFTQLQTPARFAVHHSKSQREIPAATSSLRSNLEQVLFLNPDPRKMRGYSFIIEQGLRSDAANLSSVLYRLTDEEGEDDQLLSFIRALPEQDIRGMSFLRTPREEVMVQLTESFGRKEALREAALLSDGTLRVMAVAAALLSVLPGSTVVVEEVDNGVHPSRAELLLSNIQRIARERDLRVLLTTHNPALLDALPSDALPDTVACYRDPEKGDSRLVRLEELESYPELVAQGPLGRLMTQGILDRFLKTKELRDRSKKTEQGLAWISEFRKQAKSS